MRRCAFPLRTSGIAAGPFSQTLLINSRQFPGGDAPEPRTFSITSRGSTRAGAGDVKKRILAHAPFLFSVAGGLRQSEKRPQERKGRQPTHAGGS